MCNIDRIEDILRLSARLNIQNLFLEFQEDKNYWPEILNLFNRLLNNHITFLPSFIHVFKHSKMFCFNVVNIDKWF